MTSVVPRSTPRFRGRPIGPGPERASATTGELLVELPIKGSSAPAAAGAEPLPRGLPYAGSELGRLWRMLLSRPLERG